NFTTGLNMTGSTNSIWIGNGYSYAPTSGTWTGSITLLGVNAVPAPGAIALVGLAGLVGRRRRS
ncbi:MAG: MYXO-CTERM sorting domain-containing protein, partial [Planctomycetota bacterium]